MSVIKRIEKKSREHGIYIMKILCQSNNSRTIPITRMNDESFESVCHKDTRTSTKIPLRLKGVEIQVDATFLLKLSCPLTMVSLLWIDLICSIREPFGE